MILAGGMSTRLYPLTKQVPKPLVPIAGEPNSAHVMRYLKSFGIEDIAINVHYLADKIVAAFGDGSRYGVKLHYLHEPKLLGSAGAVKQMQEFFQGETFVVVGCDGLTNLRLDEVTAFHARSNALATIALVEEEDVTHYGVVETAQDGRIVGFQEKPAAGTERSHLVNTGVYVFEPAILDMIPRGEFWDFGNNVFPDLQRSAAKFYALEMKGAYWVDIGTPGEYRQATRDVLAGKVTLLGGARASGYPADIELGLGVTLEGAFRIGSHVVLGDGVRVVGPSVIGNGVTVGAGATIEASILWDGVRVGEGSHVADSIVGLDYEIGAGANVAAAIVANEPAPA
jgi:NDP-sugar pyrophosphorylase family protein